MKICKKENCGNEIKNIRCSYCEQHRKNDKNKKCSCGKQPHFGLKDDKRPSCCVKCKTADMIDIISKRCPCGKQPIYGLKDDKRPSCCIKCKTADMIDIKNKKCSCGKQPIYGLKDDKTATCCIKCKTADMIDIKNKRCPCGKQPQFGLKDDKTATCCIKCKTADMIDITSKRCPCGKQPHFGLKDDKRPSCCFSCKTAYMINIKSKRCKLEFCETFANPKYKGYCAYCYVSQFPDEKLSRNYKTKENTIVNSIRETFPDEKIEYDKRISGGCSKRRPDCIIYKKNGHIIIIEIDETQHSSYECSCENKRIMEIYQDLGHKNIVFIRFNPDGYIDSNNKKIKSCFTMDKISGIVRVVKKDEKMFNDRLKVLNDQVNYWLVNNSSKAIETIQLFYDQN